MKGCWNLISSTFSIQVHTDGCHQLFYLDYLVVRFRFGPICLTFLSSLIYLQTLKLNDERRIAAVEKFREMMEKNSEIKLDRMRQLAEQFQLLHGHWSIYFDYNQNSLAHKVNSTWRQLIDAFFVGGLHNRAIGLSLKVTYDGYAIGESLV